MTYNDERDRLIVDNRDLVATIARKLKARLPNRIEEDDLVGYGYLVLIECAMRWDRTRGVKFRAFAYHRIEGGIKDALYREDMLPRSARRAASRNGTSKRLPKLFSLDEPRSPDGEGASWHDMLEHRTPQVLEHITRSEFPDTFIDSLQRRERQVLKLCFSESMTAKRAALELGISPNRVCQIRAQIIEHARRYYKQHGFNGIH